MEEPNNTFALIRLGISRDVPRRCYGDVPPVLSRRWVISIEWAHLTIICCQDGKSYHHAIPLWLLINRCSYFSPSLVANLWDVTDRDIDKFSQAVFDKLHLTADEVISARTQGRTETSVIKAIAQSREACKLKYLTGAAPVVYGIPFYL